MNPTPLGLQESFGPFPGLYEKLIWTAAILIALAVLRRIALQIIWSRTEDVRLRYRWRKAMSYTLYTAGALLIGTIWVQAFRSVATFFGLLSAGIAIALRDQIANLAAWLFIAWERPFQVGDRIQIGSLAGDVVDQRAFQFTLLEIGNWVEADQATGRVVHVPNGKLFTEPLVNFNQGLEYIWNEIPVSVTFESDWRKARKILEKIAEKHGQTLSDDEERRVLSGVRRFMIHFSTLKPIVYTSVVEYGVRLTIRYVCDPRQRRGSAEKIWEDILTEFARHDDIVYAYPTRRVYSHSVPVEPAVRAGLME